MIVYDNKLVSSDWHILHKNIALYEYEYRKNFFPDTQKNLSKDELQDFLENANDKEINTFLKIHNQNFLIYLKEEIDKKIEQNQINEFINLGDFIFNISENKIKLLKELDLEKYIFDIFDLLKNKWIKLEIILGNHCAWVLENDEFRNYYLKFFDKINIYKYENHIAYTHYPVGFKEGYKNSQDNECLINKTNKLESKNPKLNIHWHTHQRSFDWYEEIKYINAWWGNKLI